MTMENTTVLERKSGRAWMKTRYIQEKKLSDELLKIDLERKIVESRLSHDQRMIRLKHSQSLKRETPEPSVEPNHVTIDLSPISPVHRSRSFSYGNKTEMPERSKTADVLDTSGRFLTVNSPRRRGSVDQTKTRSSPVMLPRIAIKAVLVANKSG